MKEGTAIAKDFSALASSAVEFVGGADSTKSAVHCITRLRFFLVDQGKADADAIKKVKGVMGVVIGNGQYQVVIGPDIFDAYDAVPKVTGADKAGGEQEVLADEGPFPARRRTPSPCSPRPRSASGGALCLSGSA